MPFPYFREEEWSARERSSTWPRWQALLIQGRGRRTGDLIPRSGNPILFYVAPSRLLAFSREIVAHFGGSEAPDAPSPDPQCTRPGASGFVSGVGHPILREGAKTQRRD